MKRFMLVVSCVVACSSDEGGRAITVDELGGALSVASCAKQFECCTSAEIMARYMGITHDGQPIETEAQCVDFSTAVFTSLAVEGYRASIAAGRITYDSAAAGACISAIEAISCADYATESTDALVGCRPYLLPQVADGGACLHDYECTSDNCEGASTPLGGPNVDGACAPLPGPAEPCDENCPAGYYCGREPTTSGGDTCLAVRPDGATCIRDDECASDHCASGNQRVCATKPLTCDGP